MARRRLALGSMAAAIAIALAGGAAAQIGLRIETIEPVGDWDRVAVAGTTHISNELHRLCARGN